MKKLILSIAMMLMVLFSFGQHRHYANQGGHYVGGHGSSHRGGHYVNSRTHNHYTHHRR
jgi:hypothetical protein